MDALDASPALVLTALNASSAPASLVEAPPANVASA